MVDIIEFIARLDQGYCEAFLCRGSDGHQYVAKSRRSGLKSLISEWVCGRVGRELGLPIPPFDLLGTQQGVAELSANEDLAALAVMPGFGSQYVGIPQGDSLVALPILNPAEASSVGVELRRRVLLFDWWIRNHDRTDDNPNLLFDPSDGRLHVIDHNLAFDEDPPEQFWSGHIFRGTPASPMALNREADLPAMRAILDVLPTIWSEMPEPWTESEVLTFARVDETLRQCLTDDFWGPR